MKRTLEASYTLIIELNPNISLSLSPFLKFIFVQDISYNTNLILFVVMNNSSYLAK